MKIMMMKIMMAIITEMIKIRVSQCMDNHFLNHKALQKWKVQCWNGSELSSAIIDYYITDVSIIHMYMQQSLITLFCKLSKVNVCHPEFFRTKDKWKVISNLATSVLLKLLKQSNTDLKATKCAIFSSSKCCL